MKLICTNGIALIGGMATVAYILWKSPQIRSLVTKRLINAEKFIVSILQKGAPHEML